MPCSLQHKVHCVEQVISNKSSIVLKYNANCQWCCCIYKIYRLRSLLVQTKYRWFQVSLKRNFRHWLCPQTFPWHLEKEKTKIANPPPVLKEKEKHFPFWLLLKASLTFTAKTLKTMDFDIIVN
jgi:hypothetical protein